MAVWKITSVSLISCNLELRTVFIIICKRTYSMLAALLKYLIYHVFLYH